MLRGSGSLIDAAAQAMLVAGTYAGIYVFDGGDNQSIDAGSTLTKLLAWELAGGANGLASNATAQHDQSQLVADVNGTYFIEYNLSYVLQASAVFEFYVCVDGVQQENTGATAFSLTAEADHIGGFGHVAVAAGSVIDLRCFHDQGGAVKIGVTHANLTMARVGA